MKKLILALIILVALVILGFVLGPKPDFEEISTTYTTNDLRIEELDSIIEYRESQITDLKPDNDARIVWADSTRSKTPYSIVYLHGFSASRMEGNPIHVDIAKRYGCNLFLSRLADHGRSDRNTFKGLTPKDLIESAKWAISIGKTIGEKVIIMSCSTGGTYAAILSGGDPDIEANIMYSPNIDLYDTNSGLLIGPWGRRMGLMAFGGEYYKINYDAEPAKYWNEIYHIDGITAMKWLIDRYMNKETFQRITQPLFLGYYYKNEEEQDKVVSIPRMHDFFNQISTPESDKRMIAFPNVKSHVIGSSIMSKDVESVKSETIQFIDDILNLPIATKNSGTTN